jgi:hypothetical protein
VSTDCDAELLSQLRLQLSKKDALRLGALLCEVTAEESVLRRVIREVLLLCGLGTPETHEVDDDPSCTSSRNALPSSKLVADRGPWTWSDLVSMGEDPYPLNLEEITTFVENLMTSLLETRSPRSLDLSML